MRNKYFIIGISSLAVATAIAYAYKVTHPDLHITQVATNSEMHAAGDDTSGTEPDFPKALEDDKVLVGYSHDVFVGKVITQIGSESRVHLLPEHQYAVNVLLNIKGNLHGVVTVDRDGLLDVGTTYVFASRYYKEKGWYVVSIPPQITVLTSDTSLNDSRLTALAIKSEKVKAFQGAYPDEQLDQGDVRNGWAYNSYASRHYDSQGNLIDDTVVLAKQNGFTPLPNPPSDSSATSGTPPVTQAPANTAGPAPRVVPAAAPAASGTPEPAPSRAPGAPPVVPPPLPTAS